jgi:hypothetical protein
MDLSFDPSYPFGSQTANLEYSMLSAILGNPSADTPSVDIPSPMLDNTSSGGQATGWSGVAPFPQASGVYPQSVPPDLTRSAVLGSSATPPSATTASTSYLRTLGTSSPPILTDSPGICVEPVPGPSLDMRQGDSAYGAAAGASGSSGLTDMLPQQSGSSRPAVAQATGQWRPVGDSVYSQVVAGYDYTQGYHFLMRFLSERSAIPFRFLSRRASATAATAPGDSSTVSDEGGGDDFSVLRGSLESPRASDRTSSSFPSDPPKVPLGVVNPEPRYIPPPSSSLPQNNHVIDQMPMSCRFEKNDILRVVRALAIFRPSLIALQMPMTEQDEIFVERALQRSLLVSIYYSIIVPFGPERPLKSLRSSKS